MNTKKTIALFFVQIILSGIIIALIVTSHFLTSASYVKSLKFVFFDVPVNKKLSGDITLFISIFLTSFQTILILITFMTYLKENQR